MFVSDNTSAHLNVGHIVVLLPSLFWWVTLVTLGGSYNSSRLRRVETSASSFTAARDAWKIFSSRAQIRFCDHPLFPHRKKQKITPGQG